MMFLLVTFLRVSLVMQIVSDSCVYISQQSDSKINGVVSLVSLHGVGTPDSVVANVLKLSRKKPIPIYFLFICS